MPQLEKGGKWVFGWTLVGEDNQIVIPSEAFSEYGFAVGETVVFLRGSRRSGGFGVGRPEKLAHTKIPITQHVFAQGCIQPGGRLEVPPASGILPGDCLLVVRGSGFALGFLARGPIVEIARNHPEIERYA